MEPQNTEVVTQAPAPKRSTGKVIAITCVVLLILSVLCCGAIGGFGLAIGSKGLNIIKAQASEVICAASENNVEDVYKNKTTETYQESVTEEEFQQKTEKISKEECDNFKKAGFMDFVKNQWNINTATANGLTVTTFKGKIGDNQVTLEVVGQDNDLKVNNFDVQ